ncbi:T9SS type B sorting domain-containing protein [Flavobacterium myungsuense]|uniref:T9SS type B sorting domain-containing protein n=1 Tax=Flavobacterium myungsuense TaxID=651823 RepID=A0ABW3J0V0_9FLAO
MKNCILFLFLIVVFLISNTIYCNVAPIIKATGNQKYCPKTNLKIVTTITITDPDDTGTDAFYIQISSGYVFGEDILKLSGLHPTIISDWDISTGKLKLYSPSGAQITYLDFIAAIEDIEFFNSSSFPNSSRTFSISIGDANYLPLTDHYYLFIPDLGIRWNDAKVAAAASTYYGLQGYLATITSDEEARFAGKQAAGTGWIGGTDEENESVWKWATGPERGTIFWNGYVNGTTPNFAFWNTNEPNQFGGIPENYAHITAPGVGILGSWNDLPDAGESSGNYQPKGYIVEYGGMPGDPIIEISTTTSITIQATPSLKADEVICSQTALTTTFNFPEGVLDWYTNLTGGAKIATGNTFTTPVLTQKTTYYYDFGCTERVPFTVDVIAIPTITSTINPIPLCGTNDINLEASASAGTVNWYSSSTSTKIEAIGTKVTIPNIKQSGTYYAEAVDRKCTSLQRTPLNIIVYQSPDVSDEEIIICQGKSISITAGVANMNYLWSTGEKTQSIFINGLKNYSVIVTSPAPENCSKTKNITIIENTVPKIAEIIVTEFNAKIVTNGIGDFEYSIDEKNYQDSPLFNFEKGGLYTAYVRDKNKCGKDSQRFVIISIPAFFTPNNDGSNDFWTVKNIEVYKAFKIDIFNRYGKLITQLNVSNKQWDGTLNGKPLPADDYWYVAKIDESIPIKKGHFSLKR